MPWESDNVLHEVRRATNLGQKAEVIVEYFRTKTAAKIDGQAKAMVVTRSRLHAVRYKQAIDTYIASKGYDKGQHPLKGVGGVLRDCP